MDMGERLNKFGALKGDLHDRTIRDWVPSTRE
jgi:hypothetical protein